MSASFNLYPVLTNEQISAAIPSPSSITFYYFDNGAEQALTLENKTDNDFNFSADLQDPRCNWYAEDYDLYMERTLRVEDSSLWFGKNGVVPENATIGIAQQWISVKTEMRGIIPMGEIHNGDKNLEFLVDHVFKQKTIKGSLVLKTIIYLKDAGSPSKDENIFCSQTGTILGEIDCCEIFIDGNGSVFPIATINDPNQPLWTVYYDESADPMQDAFDHEHVEVRLNQAHPCYDQLKIESSLKDSPLFLEVISSALMIIIDSAKESLGPDWDNVVSGSQTFEHGSIAEAISYFVTKLDWDISSPSKLAQSIHSFFDANLQGGLL